MLVIAFACGNYIKIESGRIKQRYPRKENITKGGKFFQLVLRVKAQHVIPAKAGIPHKGGGFRVKPGMTGETSIRISSKIM
jgi:hypothetical protein